MSYKLWKTKLYYHIISNLFNNNDFCLIFIADLKDCDRVLYGLIEEMIQRKENRIGLSEVKKQLTDMLLSAKLTCDSSEPDKVLIFYLIELRIKFI